MNYKTSFKRIINIIFLLILLIPVFLCSDRKEKTGFIIAHRGASGHAPENTLSAVNLAIKYNADLIEIDVHQSKDNALVVIHDYTLDRTTNSAGNISDMVYGDSGKTVDAGSWYDKIFKNEPLPVLEDVMLAVKGKSKLLIEVKGSSERYPGIEGRITDLIKKHGAYDWCIVQSFNFDIVKKVYEIDRKIEVHYLTGDKIEELPFIKDKNKLPDYEFLKAINPSWKSVTKENVKILHSLNFKSFVWTVNDSAKIEEIFNLGVDGVITNYPDYKENK